MTDQSPPPGHRASFPHRGVRVVGTISGTAPAGRVSLALYDAEGGVEYVYVWPHDLTVLGPSTEEEQLAVITDEPLSPGPTDSVPTDLLYPAGSWACALIGGVWRLVLAVGHGQVMKRGQLSKGTADTVVVSLDETLRVLSVNRAQIRPAPPIEEGQDKPRLPPPPAPAPVQPQPALGPLFEGLT